MKSVLCACGLAGMFAISSTVAANNLDGTYVSDIKSSSDWQFKRKYRELELTIRQDGDWILAGESKYGTRVSGIRKGNEILFYVEPGNLTGEEYQNAYGQWTVDGANLNGKWKIDGSYSASGKWNLAPGECKPKKCGLPPDAAEALMSELVVTIGSGGPQAFREVAGPLELVDPRTEKDLPTKRLKLKSISGELEWLKAFNLDGNSAVDAVEMCHAWLVKLIEVQVGKPVAPGALQFEPSNGEDSAVCLARAQRQSVNARLLAAAEGTSSTAKELQALYQLFPQFRGQAELKEGEGGDGGGGGGGGGSGGGGM